MKICCRQQFYFYPIYLLYLNNISRSRNFRCLFSLGDSTSGDNSLGVSSSGGLFSGDIVHNFG
jgi:hypothetical protein